MVRADAPVTPDATEDARDEVLRTLDAFDALAPRSNIADQLRARMLDRGDTYELDRGDIYEIAAWLQRKDGP